MGLLSLKKIDELFGVPMKLEDVSGSVDGTQFSMLVEGEEVILTGKRIEEGGNFICRKGDREIRGIMRRGVETIAWQTPSGRVLYLGSLYKKQFNEETEVESLNPKNVGIIEASVKNGLADKYFGKTIVVGPSEVIKVKAFNPPVGESTFVPGRWNSFTVK